MPCPKCGKTDVHEPNTTSTPTHQDCWLLEFGGGFCKVIVYCPHCGIKLAESKEIPYHTHQIIRCDRCLGRGESFIPTCLTQPGPCPKCLGIGFLLI